MPGYRHAVSDAELLSPFEEPATGPVRSRWTPGWFATGPLLMTALVLSSVLGVPRALQRPVLDGPLAIALLTICAVAAAFRPAWPLPLLLVVAGATVAHAASGFTVAPLALIALWLCAATVVRRSSLGVAAAGLLVAFLVYVVTDVLYDGKAPMWGNAVAFVAYAVAAGGVMRVIDGKRASR